MKAIILAAGMGKRLGKITENIPKALVVINGKSVLEIAVEKCTSSGFDDIIINVHHYADMVEEEAKRLNKKGFRITVSDERAGLLETGGGLHKAKSFFNTNAFLMYNADIVTDIDLNILYNFHQQNKGLATLAVRNRQGNRYFLVDSKGILCGWCNKATGEEIITRNKNEKLEEIAFCGIHIINPEIFDYMSEGIFTMTKLYLQLAASHNIFTYRCDGGYWFDIGTSENLENAREFLKTNKK